MNLLFDIGGTSIRLAVSEDSKDISDQTIVDTPDSYEEGVRLLVEKAKEIGSGQEFSSAAGGVAAVFDGPHSTILRGPHLRNWEGRNIKRDLSGSLGCEVHLRNDTDMAGLGEAAFGAGRGFSIIAYITISTGIGGSRITDKKIDRFSVGFEPGHQIIDADGSICPDCVSFENSSGIGHWEAIASGAAIERRFNKKADEITDPEIWDEICDLIVVGLNNTIVHWSPDAVILGGGLMRSSYLKIEDIKIKLASILKIFPETPAIRSAELGHFSAIYGALHYLNQR